MAKSDDVTNGCAMVDVRRARHVAIDDALNNIIGLTYPHGESSRVKDRLKDHVDAMQLIRERIRRLEYDIRMLNALGGKSPDAPEPGCICGEHHA